MVKYFVCLPVSLFCLETLMFTFATESFAYEFATHRFVDRHIVLNDTAYMWSSDWPTDMRLSYLGWSKLSLKIRCLFPEYQANMTMMQLCFKYLKSNNLTMDCVSVNAKKTNASYLFGGVNIIARYGGDHGLHASIIGVPPETELPLAAITCRIDTNTLGAASSNQLFLLDFRKQTPLGAGRMWRPSTAPKFIRNKPSMVKCHNNNFVPDMDKKLKSWGRSHHHPRIPLRHEWYYCTDADEKKCETSKAKITEGLESYKKWSAATLLTGELWSAFIRKEVEAKLKGRRLMCYMLNNLVAFYSSPVIFEGAYGIPATSSLPIPKADTRITFYNGDNVQMKLPCGGIIAPKVKYGEIFWKIQAPNDRTWKIFLYAGFKNKRFRVSADKFAQITFHSPFSSLLHEAVFTCILQGTGPKGEQININKSYTLDIKSSPKLKKGFPKVFYLPYCGYGEFLCRYADSVNVYASMSVMGVELDIASNASLRRSEDIINKRYKGVIHPLQFYVDHVNPYPGKPVKYFEWNQYRKPTAHLFACTGKRPPFSIQWRVKVKSTFNIFVSKVRRCNFFCSLFCDITNHKLTSGGKTKVEVEWYTQSNDKCSTAGKSISKGRDLYYNTTDIVGGYAKCVVRLINPACGGKFWEACLVSKIDYIPPDVTPLWVILVTILGIALLLVVLNAIRYYVFVRKCLNWDIIRTRV